MSFPDTIDRHLGREWLKSFGLTTGFVLGLFYIQNLYDNLGDFLKHGAGIVEILKYFLWLTPSLLLPVLPLSVLVSTLISYGTLHRNQEITAMRSTGRGIWGLMRMNLFFGVLLSAGLYLLGSGGLSLSVEKSREIHERLAWKETNLKETGWIQHLTFENSAARRLWVMNRFHQPTNTGYGVYLYRRDEQGQVLERFTSRTAVFDADTDTWTFREGRRVPFNKAGLPKQLDDFKELKLQNIDSPRMLLARQKKIGDLSIKELQDLKKVHAGGGDKESKRYAVRYHQALAGSFNCVLALMVGVPFALGGTRTNPMVGASKAILIFVAFLILSGLSRLLGEQEIIKPIVAGWSPLLAMGLFALYLTGKVR